VSWDNIQTFLQKFNEKTGKQYRLPTEAEWEYACCSGGASEYCGSDNMDSVAWYASNSGRTTHPATIKQANAFGLYDMSGNVREWVQDSYLDSYHGAPTNGSEW
jgi:formylglycine-generating enzyme required for sulfatase activity